VSSASSETTTSPDPVLTAERAHLARAADCLTEMRAAAHAVTDAGVDAWASERLGAARAERLRHLAADPGVPPFFGRTDTGTETFHIGRRHVRDAAGDPVVIDWRAPMSRPFYQASAVEPQGLIRRRRFGFAAGELTGYEDERLETGDDGPGEFLRAEIERPRSGPMSRMGPLRGRSISSSSKWLGCSSAEPSSSSSKLVSSPAEKPNRRRRTRPCGSAALAW